ncbi:MAG: hypothetical protein ACK5OX_15390 [Desertimonas sp.]
MPPYTTRLRFLIPRRPLPHTETGAPHVIWTRSGHPIELHIRPGTGSNPDHLILIVRGIPTEDDAVSHGASAKAALMRAGLISNVPMLLGNDTSSSGLAPALIELARGASGITPRPDVHGIDIRDETDGPFSTHHMEAAGFAQERIDTFLEHLADPLAERHPSFAPDDRLGLAIEVFMAASSERTPRARFLDLVTVLEILADAQPSSPEAVAVVDAALEFLEAHRSDMDDEEVSSLRGSLRRLRSRSISRSVRDLAADHDVNAIEGYTAGELRDFLGRCYTVRSELVHSGSASKETDIGHLAGRLSAVLRHLLIARVDGRG